MEKFPKAFLLGAATAAHQAARTVIREICPHAKVGLTLSLHDIQTVPGGEELAAQKWELEFRHYLPAIRGDDFLGVQNYTRSVIGPGGELPVPEGAETTQMDYEYYPQGLVHVLRRVAEDFQGDLLVTENGIATADDRRRQAFVQTALEGVRLCMEEGIPIKGYMHWSLLDNFEWQKGFSMTFVSSPCSKTAVYGKGTIPAIHGCFAFVYSSWAAIILARSCAASARASRRAGSHRPRSTAPTVWVCGWTAARIPACRSGPCSSGRADRDSASSVSSHRRNSCESAGCPAKAKPRCTNRRSRSQMATGTW